MRALLCSLVLAGLLANPAAAQTGAYGQQTAMLDGTPLQVFTYHPAGCTVTAVLLVFHGLERDVTGYREAAVAAGAALLHGGRRAAV